VSREDEYQVTATLDGSPLGVFDKLSGGALDSTETKYKPGGMAPQISLGGSQEASNVVIQRLYVLTRDRPLVATLLRRAGKGAMVVVKQSLDENGVAFGDPITYKGTLKMVTLPDHDSESNNAALMQLEVSTDAAIAA
jgi:hypothetical protein